MAEAKETAVDKAEGSVLAVEAVVPGKAEVDPAAGVEVPQGSESSL